jgi:hypothetical protein
MSAYSEYAKWGWATFPVAGPAYASNKDDYKTWKIPLVNWAQFQTRLPTLDEMTLWEKKWPLAYIGVTTGPFSNLFVIDTDGEKGKESLASLKIPIPITKISQTQRGNHFFFKWSKRLEGYVTSRNGLFPGIDIKGHGGYVIIPSAGGNRKWVCEEFCAELPEAWYAHLTKAEALPKNWQATAIAELSAGNRHDTFVRLVSSCFNAGWEVESVMAVLQPFAQKHKLDESLEALILDVQRRYYKETIVNDLETKDKRFKEMQDRTREWTGNLHSLNATAMKLHASTVHKMMELQEQYDKEAIQWVETEMGPWDKSKPFKTSEVILRLSNEIC